MSAIGIIMNMIPSWIRFVLFLVISFGGLYCHFFIETSHTHKDILPTLRKTVKRYAFAFFMAGGIIFWIDQIVWCIIGLWR